MTLAAVLAISPVSPNGDIEQATVTKGGTLAVDMRAAGGFVARLTQRVRFKCSLTSCCNWSGASPDDGRFPVRPSSLIPSVGRRRQAPKAGVTKSSEGICGTHVIPPVL
jgi:hypothetical protein